MFKNDVFRNKNCNYSIFEFLQDSLYLGQFLTYFGPLYHFGIVKVCILSIQIGKIIISVLEMQWSKTWVQKLLHNPLHTPTSSLSYILRLMKWETAPVFYQPSWWLDIFGPMCPCKSMGFKCFSATIFGWNWNNN